MWELIRANQRKSVVLFIALALCLMALGYFAGAAFDPRSGGVSGLFIAMMVWVVLSFVSIFSGPSILLSLSRAQPVTHDVHPQLFNVVEEMKIAASLPAMPKVYIMREKAPNAFATGMSSKDSAIVVTTGLLERMNRDELQGVIAHEMSHIMNRDVQFVTLAGVLLGSVTLLSEVFLRGMYFSSGRRYSSRDSGGGQAQALILILAVVVAILAPILAQLLYFALSRQREYLADASAARLTRYPEGLASALEKLSLSTDELSVANKVTAPMYIVNPLKPKGRALSNLTSTHPPLQDRIAILRSMMQGVNYRDYQNAFAQVYGKSAPLIPASALQDKEEIPVRAASPEDPSAESARTRFRNAGDLFRAVNGFTFLTCACGLKVKLPPEFKDNGINCPRCHRYLEVPAAAMAAVSAAAGTARQAGETPGSGATDSAGPAVESGKTGGAPEQPLVYRKQSNGWESVICACGHHIQVPPAFAGMPIHCPKCRRRIAIQ